MTAATARRGDHSRSPGREDGRGLQRLGLESLRGPLEFSVRQFAKILGVFAAAIYNWEAVVAWLRSEQLSMLLALRKFAMRELAQRVAAMA